MTSWPDVTIQLCTYNRPVIIRKVLTALFEKFVYQGTLRLNINDDHSPGDYRENLFKWLADHSPFPYRIQTTGRQNSLLGKSMNIGIKSIKDDYIFFIEDDFELQDRLDISPGVALLASNHSIGMVRYSGILGHFVHASLEETDISEYLKSHRQGAMWVPGKLSFWRLLTGGDGLYIYSNRPHLKHTRFHRFYGLYPENLKLGDTEEWMAHNVKARMTEDDAPQIAVLPEHVCNPFECIQTQSYQHSEVDRVG